MERRRLAGKRVPNAVSSHSPHPIELRPAIAYILQRRTESGRLVIHAERHIQRVLPEFLLHLAADLLLRLEVGRIEPSRPQRLHLWVAGPAEPGIGAARADRNVGARRDVPHPAEISIEDAPAALVDRLAAGSPRYDAAPFHGLQIDVHADALQHVGRDL